MTKFKSVILFFVMVFTLQSIQVFGQLRGAKPSEFDRALNKYATLMYYITTSYVDSTNIKDLVDKAVVSTLSSLDPHSTYISKEDYDAMNEPLQGNFNGIGIEFNILNDTLNVISPVVGGPSERVGILAGDRIIAVDGEKIAGVQLSNDKAYKLLRGPKGSKVNLSIYRKSSNSDLDFELIRDKIPINSVDAAYEVKPGLAYIKLARFAMTSMDEIKEAFAKFNEQPKALILDLRGNSGGVLPTGIAVANQFFDSDKLLVYTEGLKAPKMIELSTGIGLFKTGKLIVLIDDGSASASEIVAGAVQDWDRGILIGRRSFGKGLVQQQLPLNDGSFIRLTIARYHTPTGRVIQRHYDNGSTEKYYADLYKRFSSGGEVFSTDNITLPDSLKYQTLKNGRTVYGGGGIMPDIFIPLDTSAYSKYSGQLGRKSILNQFILNYMDNNRDKLKKQYKDFKDFNKRFTVTGDLFTQMLEFAEKQGVKRNDADIAISGDDIRSVMKALIARDLFSSTEYYQIINSERDNVYKKAIEVIDKWDYYDKTVLH
ncbi:MAG: S41 family peptidase [Prevotellaceae bacterium]|jgi:carboxyl-terminal processing protease|nr:S41 family peptidase [Prevotellaceae bacterium]